MHRTRRKTTKNKKISEANVRATSKQEVKDIISMRFKGETLLVQEEKNIINMLLKYAHMMRVRASYRG